MAAHWATKHWHDRHWAGKHWIGVFAVELHTLSLAINQHTEEILMVADSVNIALAVASEVAQSVPVCRTAIVVLRIKSIEAESLAIKQQETVTVER